jgi:predicted small metal-binding protein
MKTMTCKQMGGECDAKIAGSTPDEMMANGMKHLEQAHPKMAADVKKASKTDPMMVEWNKKFQADFAAAPEM